MRFFTYFIVLINNILYNYYWKIFKIKYKIIYLPGLKYRRKNTVRKEKCRIIFKFQGLETHRVRLLKSWPVGTGVRSEKNGKAGSLPNCILVQEQIVFRNILAVIRRFHANLLFKGIIKTLARSKSGFNGYSLNFIIPVSVVIHHFF